MSESEPKDIHPEFGLTHGRPSRPAAAAAIKAHVAVIKGKPLRAAISEALDKAPDLGGKERRFAAWAARELSRHLRWIDLHARTLGQPVSGLQLDEDKAIVRYLVWRRVVSKASSARAVMEVALPGPTRPRSIPDQILTQVAEKPIPPADLPADPTERSATIHSFPNWLAQAISASAPAGALEQVLEALNRDPGLSLRVRPPGSRDEVLALLAAKEISVEACAEHPDAIRTVGEGRAIFESAPMKTRRLQVMDLGSQLLAALCRATTGMTVVDWCAGAGGKSLFLADQVAPHGRVFATDLKRKRLDEARIRAKELGIKNISFPEEIPLERADIVLVDAPCSGSGTLSREPDQKWKLSRDKVTELVKTQGEILDTVSARMKPAGVLVYGTCSVLREENEAVVDAFLQRHPGWKRDGEDLRVWPHQIDGGGFFGARLTKAN